MTSFKLKTAEKAVLFGLIFSILLSFAKFDASCEELRQNVLRLHILANSNLSVDQEIKLKVRDEILKSSKKIFLDCDDLISAENNAKENLNAFENAANKVLKEGGFSYNATAELKKTYFTTREYETFTLPAGYYDSLTITLGSGEGHNWWCVMFPAVCVPSSSEKLEKSVSKNGTEIAENYKKYKIKFKSVELIEDVKRKLKHHSSSKAPV